METQKFTVGDTVYETLHPKQKLVITGANGKLYHCKIQEDMKRAAIVYQERELKGE